MPHGTKIAALAASSIIIAMAYGSIYERYQVVSTRIPITAGAELAGLKVVHFSDLHFQGVGVRETRLRERINNERPDIILFTGDLFNSSDALEDQELLVEALAFLQTLQFTRGFFAVLGEEEYPFRELLRDQLKTINVTLLDDEVARLPYGRTTINVMGLTEDSKTLDT
jgi:predicted MPP superfamily phosphohydrolase